MLKKNIFFIFLIFFCLLNVSILSSGVLSLYESNYKKRFYSPIYRTRGIPDGIYIYKLYKIVEGEKLLPVTQGYFRLIRNSKNLYYICYNGENVWININNTIIKNECNKVYDIKFKIDTTGGITFISNIGKKYFYHPYYKTPTRIIVKNYYLGYALYQIKFYKYKEKFEK